MRRSTGAGGEVDGDAEQPGDHDQRVHAWRSRRTVCATAISCAEAGRADDQLGGDREDQRHRGGRAGRRSSRTAARSARRTYRTRAHGAEAGKLRAVSSATGSTSRRRTAPGRGPARTPRRRPAAASSRRSVPYSSTASGISATDGIGRRNSIVEAVRRAQHRHRADHDADDDAGRDRDGQADRPAGSVSPTARQNAPVADLVGRGRRGCGWPAAGSRSTTRPVRGSASTSTSSAGRPARPSSRCRPSRCAVPRRSRSVDGAVTAAAWPRSGVAPPKMPSLRAELGRASRTDAG